METIAPFVGTRLQPNGTDDTGQIVDAIKARTRGGAVILDEGEFIITETLDLTTGVHLRGQGGLQPRLRGSVPATRLTWNGASGPDAQAMIRIVEADGCGIHELCLDCQRAAYRAVLLYGGEMFVSRGVSSVNPQGPHWTIEASADRNSDWVTLYDPQMYDGTGGGVVLDGNMDAQGVEHNACHVRLYNANIQQIDGVALYLGRCDSCAFYSLMTPGVADVGVLITDPVLARSNSFFQPQLGGKCSFKINNAKLPFKGLPTKVYDYNQENGEIWPITDTGTDWRNFVKTF